MDVLGTVDTAFGPVVLRRARAQDVAALVALLADDRLGRERTADDNTTDAADDNTLTPYLEAFAAIDRDPAHLLLVAERDEDIVGTLQLTFLPGLSRRGSWRAQIEAVRVAVALRSQGLGAAMIRWAIDEARRRDCALVQLTSDIRREAAHRFYRRLGFEPSHTGFKMRLSP